MKQRRKLPGCFVVALVVVVGAVSGAIVWTLSFTEPRETTVVEVWEKDRIAPRIVSIDYDPDDNVVYFVEYRGDHNVLARYHLDTEVRETLHVQGRLPAGWLSLSKRGTVFVLDVGDNPHELPWTETARPRMILELEDTTVVNSYPLLTEKDLIERSGRDERARDAIEIGCQNAIDASSSQVPLGLQRMNRIRRPGTREEKRQREELMAGLPFAFVPRFVILSSDGAGDAVLAAETCGVGVFQHLRDGIFSNNLSRLNVQLVSQTDADPEASLIDSSRSLSLRDAPGSFGLGYIFREGCAWQYDQLKWGSSKMNMGSCVHGINALPESFDVYTPEGDLLYLRVTGIHRLSPP